MVREGSHRGGVRRWCPRPVEVQVDAVLLGLRPEERVVSSAADVCTPLDFSAGMTGL